MARSRCGGCRQLHRQRSRTAHRETRSGRERGRVRKLVERFSDEMSIEDWRRKIDEIDNKLVELLNERSKCALEIGKIKHALNLRVYDPEREREILRRIKEANAGPLDDEGLQRLFERVIDECHRIERLERDRDSK